MSGMSTEGSIESILKQRAAVYGSYKTGVMVRSNIVEALMFKFDETHAGIDDTEQAEFRIMFSDLALKLMRFAADPSYEDSAKDLIGYMTLINESIQGRDSADN